MLKLMSNLIYRAQRIEAEKAVRHLLNTFDPNPTREGLTDTPARVIRAWEELTAGYQQDPAVILARDFDGAKYDEMVACMDIDFHSMCEHHLLTFRGRAHVAYLPSKKHGRVVGLSKLARLVDCFARRLQIQEQMTMQIADALQKHLKPAGVGVIIEAQHFCMCARGVQKQNSTMVTSALTGVFKNGAPRQEFLALVAMVKK